MNIHLELHGFVCETRTASLLKSYLLTLLEAGKKLPGNNGAVNKKMIAERAGFNRQSLYRGRGSNETIELYEWAKSNIGVENNNDVLLCDDKSGEMSSPQIQNEILALKREVSNLTKIIEKKNKDIEMLTSKVRELKAEIRYEKTTIKYRILGYEIVI